MRISRFPKKFISFLKEVKLEVRKVNWPSGKEIFKDTLIVIGVSLALAIFLGGLDAIFKEILDQFIL